MERKGKSKRKSRNPEPQTINTRCHVHYRDSFTVTLDEVFFILCIFVSFGLVFLVARKRDTTKSKIHSLFKHIDFFVALDDENTQDPSIQNWLKSSEDNDLFESADKRILIIFVVLFLVCFLFWTGIQKENQHQLLQWKVQWQALANFI